MKREAHGHTKMKRLCKLLDLPLWGAVGILESLWKLTAQEAPQGDIGKLSDEDIALGIDWKGDSGALISALRESRWIDVTDSHRYIIHDWHEHSDDSLDMKLARCGKLYANNYTPRMSKLSKEERAKICAIFAWPGASVFICGTKRHEKALPVTSHQSPAPEPAPVPEELSLLSPVEATEQIKPQVFPEIWNKLSGTLPKVEEFSDSRRKKVKARVHQGITPDRFTEAVRACVEKPFLRGENERGWTATFDWLVENDRNIEKAITQPYGMKPAVVPNPMARMRFANGGAK